MANPQRYRNPDPIIPGRKYDHWLGEDQADRDIYRRLRYLEEVTVKTATAAGSASSSTSLTLPYTVTNYDADRTIDASSSTVNELLDLVCTLIADLRTAGVIP